MLQQGILNPGHLHLIARIRHTNRLVIADWAFPFWTEIEVVDLSLIREPGPHSKYGVPGRRADPMKAIQFTQSGEIQVVGLPEPPGTWQYATTYST